jgi:hypothetical protein
MMMWLGGGCGFSRNNARRMDDQKGTQLIDFSSDGG